MDDGRRYCAEEFLNARRDPPTPYMEGLRFDPGVGTADPRPRLLPDDELERGVAGGK